MEERRTLHLSLTSHSTEALSLSLVTESLREFVPEPLSREATLQEQTCSVRMEQTRWSTLEQTVPGLLKCRFGWARGPRTVRDV